jgi:hypothetical protein
MSTLWCSEVVGTHIFIEPFFQKTVQFLIQRVDQEGEDRWCWNLSNRELAKEVYGSLGEDTLPNNALLLMSSKTNHVVNGFITQRSPSKLEEVLHPPSNIIEDIGSKQH